MEQVDTSLDKKVMVRSLAPWMTGAPRKTSSGDISIAPNGSILLSREEIISQVQHGNRLFIGVDGIGGHATWYVEDAFTRNELSFDTEDNKQVFLSRDMVKKMFSVRNMTSFESEIRKNVVTRAEKAFLIESIKVLKLNDYDKISFCLTYTGLKM